jgi:trimeric autotransporter adhesin
MNNRRTRSFYFKTGRCERLEDRNMLSGHPIAAMFSPATLGFGFRARAAANFSVGTLQSSATAGYGAGTVLTAALTDSTSGATGTVTYSTGSHCGNAETELTISVTGAADNTSLDISIGGTVVGTLMTDSTGAGKLVLSSDPSGTEQSLPSNFPTSIAAGTAVTVGSLGGTFAAPTSNGGSDDGGSSGCSHSVGTRFSASLTDATGATGTATVTTKTYNGTTTTKFTVSVTGAADSSPLDVVIDGTTVGTLMTDSTGAGTLALSSNPTGIEQPLPSNFPTVSSGSTITVGSLSGTFATSTTSVSAHFAQAHRHWR